MRNVHRPTNKSRKAAERLIKAYNTVLDELEPLERDDDDVYRLISHLSATVTDASLLLKYGKRKPMISDE